MLMARIGIFNTNEIHVSFKFWCLYIYYLLFQCYDFFIWLYGVDGVANDASDRSENF